MLKRIVGLFVAVLRVSNVPAALPQQEQAQPIFTFVSEWQIPRANWPQFTEDVEKNVNPILERLMADGTLVSWGNFENIVHTADGITHGSWLSSTSIGDITRALDEIRKSAALRGTGAIAATKHEDRLMRTVFHRSSSVSHGTGYLRVVCTVAQPGRGGDFAAALRKYEGEVFEEQFKKGAVTSYGMDEQYVNTAPQSLRCFVATYPDGESVNKFAGAIAANFEKVGREFQEALASTTVLNSRRDMFARITYYAQK